jgi:hypothetical protein
MNLQQDIEVFISKKENIIYENLLGKEMRTSGSVVGAKKGG